jgi:exodeoxyribonuclease VII small subunit
MSDPSIKDFEAALAELDTLVKKLEDGDLSLEQSLALYERGRAVVALLPRAARRKAERRIEILTSAAS